MADLVIGLDLGTGGVRAIAVDLQGQIGCGQNPLVEESRASHHRVWVKNRIKMSLMASVIKATGATRLWKNSPSESNVGLLVNFFQLIIN